MNLNTTEGLPPVVHGMKPVVLLATHDGRASWTTCHVGGFERGTIFRLPIFDLDVVLLSMSRTPVPGQDEALLNPESRGSVTGYAQRLDNGELAQFTLPAKTSMLVRADVAYTER